MLVLIPCGGKTDVRPQPAYKLYRGSYFQACLKLALTMTAPDNIRILSAKYGLVQLNTTLEPYDLHMKDKQSVTVDVLKQQASEQGIHTATDVYFVMGSDYVNKAKQVWADGVSLLDGVGGIGKQLKWLKAEQLIRATQ